MPCWAWWIGPQTGEDGKMRVVQTKVQTHACTNRIHDSRTVTHKLCTLEYGKKGPRCVVTSLFSPSSKGTDEEAV